jgi:hypothetical protein
LQYKIVEQSMTIAAVIALLPPDVLHVMAAWEPVLAEAAVYRAGGPGEFLYWQFQPCRGPLQPNCHIRLTT